MDIGKLNYATELQKLIVQTGDALNVVRSWVDSPKEFVGSVFSERAGHYSLCICEHKDGSGMRVDLARYTGNTEVLKAVERVLEEQLERYKKEFEEL